MTSQNNKPASEGQTLALVLESLPVAVIAFKADQLIYANENYHNYVGPNTSALIKPGLKMDAFIDALYDLHEGIETSNAELDQLHKTDKAAWKAERQKVYYENGKFDDYDSEIGWWRAINRYYPEDEIYVGIRIDINSLKNAQEKAVIASRSKSEFLANMSHEIRTPMNGIMGMAELLGNSDISGKEREFINIIQRSGQSLLTIINDILDFSKIESGQIELDLAPFVLRDAIEDIMALLSTATRETGIDLIIKIDPNLPTTFFGDVGRIRQILMNVIGNAVKFTHTGHVLIDVNAKRDTRIIADLEEDIDLKIDIIDTGIGIPDDKAEHIFEQFNQADSSTTREYGGTGLGLSIAKNLTDLMGGDLSVSSEVDVGSTFTLDLSLPSRPAQNTTIDTNTNLPIKGNILIIDDTCVNHEVLKGQLDSETCKTIGVDSAAKGLSALKKAHENHVPIHLILLDYHMPQHTGEDFIRAMRKHNCFDHIPVIMLSSVDTDALKKRVLAAGVQEFMTKPARLADMNRVISRTLNKSQIDRELSIASHSTTPLKEGLTTPKVSPTKPQQEQNTPVTDEASHIDILIAEDNEVNQMYIKYIMEDLGVSFKIVENGRMAVDKWQLLKPKIILMDVSMPQLNGYEATQKIRDIEDTHQYTPTPIIAVTAHAMKNDREKSLSAGMDDHLSKPVSRTSLIEKIAQWAPDIPIASKLGITKAS